MIGHITTWGVQCGIAKHLSYWLSFVHHPERHIIFSEFPPVWLPSCDSFPSLSVIRCWKRGSGMGLTSVIGSIDPSIKVLHVQFDPSFFSFDDIRSFNILSSQLGVKKVFTFHSIPEWPLFAKEIHEVLREADVVVVGTPAMEEALVKRCGEHHIPAKRIVLIPLPAPFVPSAVAVADGKKEKGPGFPELLMWGFPSCYKREFEVLKQVELLLKEFPSLHCLVVGSAITKEHENTLAQMLAFSERRPWLEVRNEWLGDEELTRLCRKADCIILNHANQWPSSSGTVGVSIASGTPVVISESLMFSGFEKAAISARSDFGSAVKTALKPCEERESEAKKAAERISPKRIAEVYEKLYSELMGEK